MDKTHVERLIKQCHSDDPIIQAQAILELLDGEVYEATSALLELLSSPYDNVRATSSYALGFLGADQKREVGLALVELLTDPESIVRNDALEAIGRLRYLPARQKVQRLLLYDPEPFVRASAAEVLGDFGDGRDLHILETALNNDFDNKVRAYAALSIGLVGSIDILPTLRRYIEKETDSHVKAELLGAAYRLGGQNELQSLVNLAESADEDLAISLLNILEDLLPRKYLLASSTDITSFRRALKTLADRFPNYAVHAQRILTSIDEFPQQT